MKTLFNIMLLSLSLSYANAQVVNKKDTVYYLADTIKTPVKDRILTAETVKDFKFYTIKCYCLTTNYHIVFRGNISKQLLLNKITFKKIKLISLPQLIELATKNDNTYFDQKFVIYFIEPAGRKYVQQKVFFLGGHNTIVQ